MLSFPQVENFVQINGKEICHGCAVHDNHEHSCHGPGCQCNNAECVIRQGRDPNEIPGYKEFVEKNKLK